MFCTKCGAQNPDGAAFCVKCGTQLAASAPAAVQLVKKRKIVPIIIGFCGVVIAAFLVVLFTVILPKNSTEGKLKHSWTREEGSYTETYDFAHSEYRYGFGDFRVANKFDWSVDGDILSITTYPFAEMPDVTSTTSYRVSFSDNDRVVTLTNVDDPSGIVVFKRED